MNTIEQVNILCRSLQGLKDVADIALMFDEEERSFFRLPVAVPVPSFPVHHDLRNTVPSADYIHRLTSVLNELSAQVPELLVGTRIRFDPARVLQPVFHRPLNGSEGNDGTERNRSEPGTSEPQVALRVQIDLRSHPQHTRVIRSAGNDYTAEYETRDLYADVEIVAVEEDGCSVRQLLSPTWIGERGRGYVAQGIWIDRDLTRFFTALVEPSPAQLYPYYPFSSRFRSLTHRPPSWKREDITLSVERYQHISAVLFPAIPEIERTFRAKGFSRDLPLISELSGRIPAWIRESFEGMHCRRSLTDGGLMEYTLERSS
ncbi:MAG: hypothetical protein ACOCZ9_00555 [Spirochaetota bacterium]